MWHAINSTITVSWGLRPKMSNPNLARAWSSSYRNEYHLCPYSGVFIPSSREVIRADLARFSNSQSVLLASAVRVAQSLGLHRLGKPKRTSHEAQNETRTDMVQREVGKRIWQQLTTQDWFSVPFSESYCTWLFGHLLESQICVVY
jgi:hypothetical protein